MKNTMKFARAGVAQKDTRHPLRLTALLYLKEALFKEEYETCGFLIGTAQEFGATDREIRQLLEDPRREPD